MRKLITLVSFAFLSASVLAGSTSSTVSADLLGNGVVTNVTLLQSRHAVTVTLLPNSSRHPAQVLRFGVGASRQDAICDLPASIKVVPLSCTADAGPLPGCVNTKGAQALVLSGGECDAIYIYWDHRTARLSWWRN